MQQSGHFIWGTVAAVGVAYPTLFYAKGLDGRIDDPIAGGKTVEFGSQAVAADRGGVTPMVVHFRLRPDPLAH